MKTCACLEKLKCLCMRLHGAVCRHCYRFGKAKRRSITISQPFDFKHVSSNPMGLDEDDLNVFREKAAASRMIAMEDQPRSNPSSAPCSPPASLFNHNSHDLASDTTSFFHNHFNQQQQQKPQKARAGYRSLASSTHRKLSFPMTSESRPCVTRSFAHTKKEYELEMETQTSLSPTSSFTTASTRGSLKFEKRGFEYGVRPL